MVYRNPLRRQWIGSRSGFEQRGSSGCHRRARDGRWDVPGATHIILKFNWVSVPRDFAGSQSLSDPPCWCGPLGIRASPAPSLLSSFVSHLSSQPFISSVSRPSHFLCHWKLADVNEPTLFSRAFRLDSNVTDEICSQILVSQPWNYGNYLISKFFRKGISEKKNFLRYFIFNLEKQK